eukprot:gnl/TRDRNA2_/TRDRNA2_200667_c0_seq1.p1 gnl/TRDRNA2_/TRDRNA2_200667_c0~~gnl/TRDRNA2_/TRDRNA2_200667_c0_seq1.p1  ORF type:complete len:775 (-),score=76.91 gnl/TRDRNA2_/TRDRNA2_200667_c0_seq1:264-2588(-)
MSFNSPSARQAYSQRSTFSTPGSPKNTPGGPPPSTRLNPAPMRRRRATSLSRANKKNWEANSPCAGEVRMRPGEIEDQVFKEKLADDAAVRARLTSSRSSPGHSCGAESPNGMGPRAWSASTIDTLSVYQPPAAKAPAAAAATAGPLPSTLERARSTDTAAASSYESPVRKQARVATTPVPSDVGQKIAFGSSSNVQRPPGSPLASSALVGKASPAGASRAQSPPSARALLAHRRRSMDLLAVDDVIGSPLWVKLSNGDDASVGSRLWRKLGTGLSGPPPPVISSAEHLPQRVRPGMESPPPIFSGEKDVDSEQQQVCNDPPEGESPTHTAFAARTMRLREGRGAFLAIRPGDDTPEPPAAASPEICEIGAAAGMPSCLVQQNRHAIAHSESPSHSPSRSSPNRDSPAMKWSLAWPITSEAMERQTSEHSQHDGDWVRRELGRRVHMVRSASVDAVPHAGDFYYGASPLREPHLRQMLTESTQLPSRPMRRPVSFSWSQEDTRSLVVPCLGKARPYSQQTTSGIVDVDNSENSPNELDKAAGAFGISSEQQPMLGSSKLLPRRARGTCAQHLVAKSAQEGCILEPARDESGINTVHPQFRFEYRSLQFQRSNSAPPPRSQQWNLLSHENAELPSSPARDNAKDPDRAAGVGSSCLRRLTKRRERCQDGGYYLKDPHLTGMKSILSNESCRTAPAEHELRINEDEQFRRLCRFTDMASLERARNVSAIKAKNDSTLSTSVAEHLRWDGVNATSPSRPPPPCGNRPSLIAQSLRWD